MERNKDNYLRFKQSDNKYSKEIFNRSGLSKDSLILKNDTMISSKNLYYTLRNDTLVQHFNWGYETEITFLRRKK